MSKKLLLADDSITIQKVIQITFAHEDYELTITDNGDAALAKAQEIVPDLVMTDIYMPGKNGYELTSAIKQDPALRHIPVLLLAGSFEPFDEDKARSCKADAWIEKPFESQNLIDKVAELLKAVRPEPEATPAPAEPEPLAVVEPVEVTDIVSEEMPLPAFDEPVAASLEAAETQEDPFGDISFEEETPAAEPAPMTEIDDWSDVAAEPEVVLPAAEDVFDFAEDFNFAEEAAAPEQVIEDFVFEEEEPASEVIEDFGVAEGNTAASESFALVEKAPLAESVSDPFEMDEEEIMILDDDDILGAEDLEPIMPEQTLAAWSRDEVAAKDVFVEEELAVESGSVFMAPVEPVAAEEVPVFLDEEPVAEKLPVFEELVTEPLPDEEVAAVFDEPEPAAIATATLDVAAQVSALSEADVEQIIEKVVTQVVEKLAGAILERVAWEVVPDLAEHLIREEIRRIKDAAA